MKPEPRYPEFFGVKIDRDLAAKIRRAAREDDRTVSGYLRRLLASALPSTPPTPPTDRDR